MQLTYQFFSSTSRFWGMGSDNQIKARWSWSDFLDRSLGPVSETDMLFGHPNGTDVTATLMSIIETAKANGHEPYKFLRYLFEELPYAQHEEDLRKLLPYNIDPQDVPEPNMVPRT